MISANSLQAVTLSLKLAFISTLLLLLLAIPIAWWLSKSQWAIKHTKIRAMLEAVIALPLVLPPTVLGFYCLIAFAPNSIIGQAWLTITGNTLAFSFSGLVIASIIYSLPFAVQPLQAGFSQLDTRLLESAYKLGASKWDTLLTVVLPICKPALISAATLSFAHTLGEFGVVLMIGGNIPGETQLVSIALYDYVESLQYGEAHRLAAFLLVSAFILLTLSYWLNRRYRFYKPWQLGGRE